MTDTNQDRKVRKTWGAWSELLSEGNMQRLDLLIEGEVKRYVRKQREEIIAWVYKQDSKISKSDLLDYLERKEGTND
jgi:hypothetical protein